MLALGGLQVVVSVGVGRTQELGGRTLGRVCCSLEGLAGSLAALDGAVLACFLALPFSRFDEAVDADAPSCSTPLALAVVASQLATMSVSALYWW